MTYSPCTLCPHQCTIDRTTTLGFCQAPPYLKINSALLHYGEEPVLIGTSGSGTIFFSHCPLQCCYCQNYTISALGRGKQVTPESFIETILTLAEKGAININLVSPTPYTSYLIPVLETLKKRNFPLPIIWNSNAYETVETLKNLEGLVDIYLPDFKYWDDDIAFRLSNVKDYRIHAQNAIKEMFRQTGHLLLDDDGVAIFGLMIRLLVLPNDLSKIDNILQWLLSEFSSELYISLMSQYYPTHKASDYPEINRGISFSEYQYAVDCLQKYGFENGFTQAIAQTPEWTPKFKV